MEQGITARGFLDTIHAHKPRAMITMIVVKIHHLLSNI